MPLMDCDEVFNYWEPLHFLLYGAGSSLQTWEYANEFALRTYAYLGPLWAISKLYQPLINYIPSWCWSLLTNQLVLLDPLSSNNKVALFVLLRSTLAALMACAEVSFCKAISENDRKSSKTCTAVGVVTGGLLLTSAGMSHASGALLPSSTLTFLWLMAGAAFLRQQHVRFIVLAITATLAIGWPFGVLMFVPLGIAVLIREKHDLFSLVSKILAITLLIQGVVMMIDSQHYDRIVSPTWNILIYNTKSGGDELYGVEPWMYYIKNLLLNFNYTVVGITAVIPLFLLKQANSSLLTLLVPMYLWLAIVGPRSHKEERFLFPIYPSICLAAALSMVTIAEGLLYWLKKSPKVDTLLFSQAMIWAPTAILSAMRAYALAKYYTAPLTVYAQLQNEQDVVDSVVCTCGEWYRFPSSFYLPTTIKSFGFVESSFQGQLPQPFTSAGSGHGVETKFNDKNLPEPDSYTSIDNCDYLIDLFTSDCRENDSLWYPIAQDSFLDQDRTSTLHRSLYIPFLHEQAIERGGVTYVDYVLYKKDYSSYYKAQRAKS
jgi:alpha-1,2-mannosyltransferase